MADNMATGFMLQEMEKRVPQEFKAMAQGMSPEQKLDFYGKVLRSIEGSKRAEGELDILGSIADSIGGIKKATQQFGKDMNQIQAGPQYQFMQHLGKPVGGKMQDLGSAFKGMFTGE